MTVSPNQRAVEDDVVARVLESFEGTEDGRLRTVMQSLVRHLHDFVRDVRLTESEWETAIAFLAAAGHITDDRRQEFVLLSDVLGISMQVIAVNNERYLDATEATVFGPFFATDAPRIELGEDIAFGAPGEPCWVSGTVTSTDGTPIAGARVDVWEADEDGLYDVQRGGDERTARGWFETDELGRYEFWGLTPTPYPIPHDGPVGELLVATSRSPMRASHLHFMVTAPGYRRLVTHIFVEGDSYLDSDSVFGVKDSLVHRFEPRTAADPTPDGRVIEGTWTQVRFDIVLPPTAPGV